MFEQLSDKLNLTFEKLRGRAHVTEADLEEALRDVRVALLEADVSLRVVKQLVATVRERAIGEKVLESITGAQQVVKIVHDALVEMLGGEAVPLVRAERPPTVLLLVGLQGSGKTTTAAKLANVLRKQGRRPVLVDSAGRLHIDDEMMREVESVVTTAKPHEVLLVVDAMTGQDAVEAATAFKARLPVSGLVLTKVDSDARGGASLSIRAATGVPVKFLGVGEKLDALEVFRPDRLAQRILGMGDVLTLVERAQENVDRKTAEDQAKKIMEARFTF